MPLKHGGRTIDNYSRSIKPMSGMKKRLSRKGGELFEKWKGD